MSMPLGPSFFTLPTHLLYYFKSVYKQTFGTPNDCVSKII